MRKLIAISFLFVFTALQYGKIISYLYCELQLEKSKNSVLKCDCEKILTDHNETSTPASLPHSHTNKEKLNEPFIAGDQMVSDNIIKINTSCFTTQSITLQSGFENLPFHPPAFLS